MARKPQEAAPDIDHDQAPTAGGSYVRNADGSLARVAHTKTRAEHDEAQKEKAADGAPAAHAATPAQE